MERDAGVQSHEGSAGAPLATAQVLEAARAASPARENGIAVFEDR